MAGRILHAVPAEAAVSASTTRTLLQISAPANQGVWISEFEVGRDSSDATPFEMFVAVQTDNGTSNSLTLLEEPPAIGGSIQTTARETFSSTEPTTTVIRRRVHCTQRYAYGRRIWIAPGTRIAIGVITESAPSSANYRCYAKLEE
jgi:hypothetical protein